jgi:hypothetical protein
MSEKKKTIKRAGAKVKKQTNADPGVDNRAEQKAEATPKPEPIITWEERIRNFFNTTEGQRLKVITDELQQRVAEDLKKAAISDRVKLPAIFKDKDLLRKREASVIAAWCFHLVVTGKAAELIEVEDPMLDWQSARTHFQIEAKQKADAYFTALAERLKAEIKSSKEVKETLEQVLFSAGLPDFNLLPEDLRWLEAAILAGIAPPNFDRFVWSGLPEIEKKLLRIHLAAEEKKAMAHLCRQLESLPTRDRIVARAALAHLQALPKKARKLITATDNQKLWLWIQKYADTYRKGFLPKKESAVERYVRIRDKLKAEGKPHKAPDVCKELDLQKWERLNTKPTTKEKREELKKWKDAVRKGISRHPTGGK